MRPSVPVARGGTGLFDDAEVDAEGRLIVRWGDGSEDGGDLANPAFLRAVLRRLRDEVRVTGVVLVRDRERAYGPRATKALESLLSLGRLLDQFARRAPAPSFPGFTAKEVEAVCARCAFRPERMFGKLRDAVLGDPVAFLAALKELAASLDAYAEEGCRACVGATAEDLRILLHEIEGG